MCIILIYILLSIKTNLPDQRAQLNRYTALELAGHVLFDVVDETNHDGFTELT